MSDGEETAPRLLPLEPGVYVHYKSPTMRYEVIGVGLETETDEPVVIYKPLYETSVKYLVRPYDMFVGTVNVDCREVPRFTKETSD